MRYQRRRTATTSCSAPPTPARRLTHFAETGFKAPSRMVPMTRVCSVQSCRFSAGPECPGFVASAENDHGGAQIERPCAGLRGWPAEQREFLERSAKRRSRKRAWPCSRVWPRRSFRRSKNTKRGRNECRRQLKGQNKRGRNEYRRQLASSRAAIDRAKAAARLRHRHVQSPLSFL